MSHKDSKFEYASDKNIIKIKTERGSKFNILQFVNKFKTPPDSGRRFSLDVLRTKSPLRVGKIIPKELEESSDSWPRMKPTNRSSISNVRRLLGESPAMASETRLSFLRQNSVDLVWSKKTYAVGDVIELVNGKWPVIVMIVDGHKGGGSELANEQVLQVFAEGKETRMKSIDSSGRLFSSSVNRSVSSNTKSTIGRTGSGPVGKPVNRNIHVIGDALDYVVKPSKSIELSTTTNSINPDADDVITDARSAMACDVTSDSNVRGDVHIGLYESRHLAANAILEGWLDTEQIIIIPEELNISFRLAQGLLDADVDEWTDYCGMYARAGRTVKLDQSNTIYPGIIYEDECNRVIRDASNVLSQNIGSNEEVDDVQQSITNEAVNQSFNHSDCETASEMIVSTNRSSFNNNHRSNYNSHSKNNDHSNFSKLKHSMKDTRQHLDGSYSSTMSSTMSSSDSTRECNPAKEMDNKGYVKDEMELNDRFTNPTELHAHRQIVSISVLDNTTSIQETQFNSPGRDDVDTGATDFVYKKRFAPAYF